MFLGTYGLHHGKARCPPAFEAVFAAVDVSESEVLQPFGGLGRKPAISAGRVDRNERVRVHDSRHAKGEGPQRCGLGARDVERFELHVPAHVEDRGLAGFQSAVKLFGADRAH